MITMFDSTDGASVMPVGNYAYAGYVNGHWPNYRSLVAAFPGKHVLSIAVSSGYDAECLDIEKGDATIAEAAPWVHRQYARGIERPVLYTSASAVNPLLTALTQSGINTMNVRIWSAHYGGGEHICGPSTCKMCLPVDGTQWNDKALGRNLDQSTLVDNFFGAIVMPDFSPAIIVEPVVSDLSCPTGGAWTLAASGAVDAWGGAPYLGGANKQPYFVNRTAAKLVRPNPVEAAAGKQYVILDTVGERYAY